MKVGLPTTGDFVIWSMKGVTEAHELEFNTIMVEDFFQTYFPSSQVTGEMNDN